MVKAYHYQQYIRDRLFWDAEIDGMIEIHFSDRTTEDMIAKMIWLQHNRMSWFLSLSGSGQSSYFVTKVYLVLIWVSDFSLNSMWVRTIEVVAAQSGAVIHHEALAYHVLRMRFHNESRVGIRLPLDLEFACCMVHDDRVESIWYNLTCCFSDNSVFVVVLGPRDGQGHGKVQTIQVCGLK